jgi:capsular polysaccharide biosynthesis protein
VGELIPVTQPNAARENTPSTEVDASEEYSGPMIDLGTLKEALRRRYKIWVGAALAGIVIGAAFHLVVPAKYAATTNLYMVEPSGQNPTQAIADDVSLLQTRSVAAKAAESLHLNVNPSAFLATYQGTAVSGVIISIKLGAATPAEAVAYDNAVANAFLAIRSQELTTQTALVVDGLQSQANSFNKDIEDLTAEINSLSASKAGSQSANQIASLVNQRTGDASQISQLQSQEQQDVLAERSVADGSQVLDAAQAEKVSSTKVAATDSLTGLVGGLLLGMGIVIVGAIISDRPRRRAEIAAALGAPVELSLGRYKSPHWARLFRLRKRLKQPPPELVMIGRRLRANLEASAGASLAVVPIGSSEVAALSVASLCWSLASEGKRVVLADMLDDHPLPRLLRSKVEPGSASTSAVSDGELTLVVMPHDPGEMVVVGLEDADVVIVLASVSPVLGAEHLAAWATNAVVFVTAGEVSVTRMTASTQILRQAGIATRSAVMIGASATDETAGLLSDELPRSSSPARSPNDGQGRMTNELRVDHGNGKLSVPPTTARSAP